MQKNINTTLMITIIFTVFLLFSNCSTGDGSSISQEYKQLNASSPKTDNQSVPSDSTLQTGWYYLADNSNGFRRQLDKDTVYYFIDPIPIITAKNIIETNIYSSNYGDKGLSMKLDNEGIEAWSNATEKAAGHHLAFIIDNKLMYVPKINGQITGGMTALNRGDVYKDELEKIKAIIDEERK